METNFDYSKITDVQVEGYRKGGPHFEDAFIASAKYDGRDMTDEELEELNQDGDFIYDQVVKHIY